MAGRATCNLLRTIRGKIAKENDIEWWETEPCYFTGDCAGTCPRCEAEIEYLEAELAKRIERSQEVKLDGIAREDMAVIREAVEQGTADGIPYGRDAYLQGVVASVFRG